MGIAVDQNKSAAIFLFISMAKFATLLNMNKNKTYTIVITIIAAVVGFLLVQRKGQNFTQKVQENEIALITNNLVYTKQLPSVIQPPTNISLTADKAALELIVSNYQTLDDLKHIKSLHEVNGFIHQQNWYSESNTVIFKLKSFNGKSENFVVSEIFALTDRKDGHVSQLNLHSPELDIDEVRHIGLQLDAAWGLDPSDFLAWCNKMGNKWLDEPLFSSQNGVPPANNQLIGFGVHRTMNNQKPWVIIINVQDNL